MTTQTLSQNKDFLRQWVDIGIENCRPYVCSQTGFLHFGLHPLKGVQESPQILFLENCQFSLLLMRSKTKAHMEEGMTLLSRLLYFQNFQIEEGKGNFPVALSDYPFCHYPTLSFSVLRTLYEWVHDFGNVLEKSLKTRLIDSIRSSLSFLQQWHLQQNQPLAELQQFRWNCLQLAFARFFNETTSLNSDTVDHQLSDHLDTIQTPEYAAKWLLFLQIVDPELSLPAGQTLIKKFLKLWDLRSSLYYGPAYVESYKEGIPKRSLMNLYIACATSHPLPKNYPYEIPHLLESSLLHPFSCHSAHLQQNSILTSYHDHLHQNLPHDRFNLPLRSFLLSQERLSSFGIQINCGKITIASLSSTKEHYFLTWTPDKEKEAPHLTIAITKTGPVNILVNNTPASYFEIQDNLQIILPEFHIECLWKMPEKLKGKFQGTVRPGKRFAELMDYHDKLPPIFDHVIMLSPLDEAKGFSLEFEILLKHIK